MSGNMYEELFYALSEFIADESLKVGIISGSDSGNFCAGDDLKSEPRPVHSVPHWPTLVPTLRRNKPIIAAADGWSLGAGFHLLLTLSDIRIATPEARFGFPEISYGMGGAGGASRLGRQLPHTIAMQLLMTGEYLNAEQALQHSLVNEIVPREKTAGSVRRACRQSCRATPARYPDRDGHVLRAVTIYHRPRP